MIGSGSRSDIAIDVNIFYGVFSINNFIFNNFFSPKKDTGFSPGCAPYSFELDVATSTTTPTTTTTTSRTESNSVTASYTSSSTTTQNFQSSSTNIGPSDSKSTSRLTTANTAECNNGYCKNGGTCVTILNDEISCVCLNGFTGKFCEEKLPESVKKSGNYKAASSHTLDKRNLRKN